MNKRKKKKKSFNKTKSNTTFNRKLSERKKLPSWFEEGQQNASKITAMVMGESPEEKTCSFGANTTKISKIRILKGDNDGHPIFNAVMKRNFHYQSTGECRPIKEHQNKSIYQLDYQTLKYVLTNAQDTK